MKLALIAKPNKYEVKDILNRIFQWSEGAEVQLYISKEICDQADLTPAKNVELTDSDIDSISQSDFIVVVGGDGTILYTARISAADTKPVLGINSGRLGFMTNTQSEDLEEALNHVLEGNFELDERHYLKATDSEGNTFYALNEFFFTRKDSTSMVNISALYDGNLINTYWADGLIVSSSTGSTAYNLSSGGPIVMPGAGVMLLTPVNPHTLTTRPLVIKADKPLVIRMEDQRSEVIVSYDGVTHEIDRLPYEIEITKSDQAFNLIQLPDQNYFETLRNKLMWGKDSRRYKN